MSVFAWEQAGVQGCCRTSTLWPVLRRSTLTPASTTLHCLLPLPQGGCIIRAGFLDRIKQAYRRDEALPNLLVDPDFAKELSERDASWRRVVALSVTNGVPVPGMTASLGYFDTYRRERLPANMVQVSRGAWVCMLCVSGV